MRNVYRRRALAADLLSFVTGIPAGELAELAYDTAERINIIELAASLASLVLSVSLETLTAEYLAEHYQQIFSCYPKGERQRIAELLAELLAEHSSIIAERRQRRAETLAELRAEYYQRREQIIKERLYK